MRDIDIWLAFYDEINDESLFAQLRQLLTEQERQQERRFYFADGRKSYLVTRAMVRTLLSRYEAVDPRDWVFAANDYGRPEISNFGDAGCDLSFNISHTRGLIALAVTRGVAVGVDVENTALRAAAIGVADRFFAPSETADLFRVPPAVQPDRFWEYWTFKESYIKARGMGLSIPLDGFSFEFPQQHGVRLTVNPELGDHGSRWRFWQFRPRADYLLALCVERADTERPGFERAGVEAPRITLRKVALTAGEDAGSMLTAEVVDLRAVRASD